MAPPGTWVGFSRVHSLQGAACLAPDEVHGDGKDLPSC